MDSTVFQRLLVEIRLSGIAIEKNERIVAANIGALTLVGWQAVGMNYISLLRQAALLHSVEATLQVRTARKTQYLGSQVPETLRFK